jgi:hypothetical protein
MALTVEYKLTARTQINEYLSRIEDQVIVLAAIAELRREFAKLAADPRLGSAPTGPFETRPIYKFRLEAGDCRRLAQVSYKVEGQFLEILLFSSVPI